MGTDDNFAAMSDNLNSVRMRAERHGLHVSGSERLVPFSALEEAALSMVTRALQHPRGPVTHISLKVDLISAPAVKFGQLPDLYNNQVASWQHGRQLASELLLSCEVTPVAIERTMAALVKGAAPDNTSMRGAMLVDADSGARLEADSARGVRASRMDLTDEARAELRALLAVWQLDNQHVVEALTLAAKVISAPQVVAELCWSDDPDYVAGYVASQRTGYQRISLLKPSGEERGGRAFFVRCAQIQLQSLVEWLEKEPMLITKIGRIHPPRDWRGG